MNPHFFVKKLYKKFIHSKNNLNKNNDKYKSKRIFYYKLK